MRLPFHVVQMLKSKGSPPWGPENYLQQPSHCEYLSLDIASKTGIRIGSTTLKRLLGFTNDERTPHVTTLDAIARYLGFAHWEELMEIEDKGNSDFDTGSDELRSAHLQHDDLVEFTYLPDRRVVLRYRGNSKYIVAESHNSKLQVGDEVEVFNFVLHHPLFVINVIRDGKELGSFTAGQVSGLSSIKLL